LTVASEGDKKAQKEMLKKIGPGLWVSFRGKLKEVLARKRVNRVLSANKSWCNTTFRESGTRRSKWKLYFFSLSGLVVLFSIRCSI
jgi:hypothetical protein